MLTDKELSNRIETLDDLAMKYETAVQAFKSVDYLKEFYDFYEIQNRDHKLVPSPYPFSEALKELSGDDVWEKIAAKTVCLFGEPKRITVFDDYKEVIDELEGENGLAPFFFVLDLMFCEYDGFTLLFISGTNN